VPGLRARQKTFQENVLRHVVRGAHTVERIGAEILNAQRAVIRADFKVFGLDVGRFNDAARDLRLDNARFTLRLFRNDLGRRLVTAVEPATAGQQSDG